jgi:hypothetical protein
MAPLCGGPPGSTRAPSPRQLPTDHDYAVSTREYQSDQPSQQRLSTTTDAAFTDIHDIAEQKADLTRSFHISGLSTLNKDQTAERGARMARRDD